MTTRLEVRDLVLNLSTHEAGRAGRSIRLTRTEFQMLEILTNNAGHVVRRCDLLREVWGANTNVEENTLDAAMSSLRARIEGLNLPQLIHKVRRSGYRRAAAK